MCQTYQTASDADLANSGGCGNSLKVDTDSSILLDSPNAQLLFPNDYELLTNDILHQILKKIFILIDERIIQFVVIHPCDQGIKVLL